MSYEIQNVIHLLNANKIAKKWSESYKVSILIWFLFLNSKNSFSKYTPDWIKFFPYCYLYQDKIKLKSNK